MAELMVIVAPLLALAGLYCGWRGLDLMATRRPAVATVWRSDYGELDQLDDFWHSTPLGTARGWEMGDGPGTRLEHDVVLFTDAQGESRRAHVSRRVARGWRPDSVYTIWYDPADPERVSAHGPGRWFLAALLAAAALAWLFAGGGAMLATR